MNNVGETSYSLYMKRNGRRFIIPGQRQEYISVLSEHLAWEYQSVGYCSLIAHLLLRDLTIDEPELEAILSAYNRLFHPSLQVTKIFEDTQCRVEKLRPYLLCFFRHPDEPKVQLEQQPEEHIKQMRNRQEVLNAEIKELRDQQKSLNADIEVLREQRAALNAEIKALNNEKYKEADEILSEARMNADNIRQAAQEEAEQKRRFTVLAAADDIRDSLPPISPAADAATMAEVEAVAHDLENKLREEMNAYRDQLQSALYSFRTGLYDTNYSPLCSFYQGFCRFVTTALDRRIDNLGSAIEDEESRNTVQAELRKLQGQLIHRVAALERSMEVMGLTLIRPADHSEYDVNEHAAENLEDDGTLTGTVERCTCPGLKVGDLVLCRAGVVVNPDQPV